MMFMPVLWNDNDEMDLFDPMQDFNNMWNSFWGDISEPANVMKSMKTDVIEEDHDYKLTADLPGFNKEDIRVDLKDGVLTIDAFHKDNKDEKDEKSGKYLRRERSAASYRRAFRVGDEIKPEEISAKYENGVLTLTLPKKEAAVTQKDDTKRIEIH